MGCTELEDWSDRAAALLDSLLQQVPAGPQADIRRILGQYRAIRSEPATLSERVERLESEIGAFVRERRPARRGVRHV